MNKIRFAVEGLGADNAAADLLEIEDLQGEIEPEQGESLTKGDPLMIAGAIVGLTAGVLTIADRIISWRDRRREQREKANQPPLKMVFQAADGRRVMLEGATREQIVELFMLLQENDNAE